MKVTGASIEQMQKDKPRNRCRVWRLWIRAEDGRHSHLFHGTYTEASNALESFKTEILETVPTSDTFGAYAAMWLAWREKSGDFTPGTLANNKRNVRALALSPLDSMELAKITPMDCRNALAWIKEHPQRKSGTLTNTTMNKIFQDLNAILSQASDDGLIAANPMQKIKPPKPDTEEKKALTPDELTSLLDALDATPLDGRVMAVYLIACLGLRRAEACAISCDDIRGGVAHVHAAMKERDGSIGKPKSKAGNRKLPMPPRLVDKCKEWMAIRTAPDNVPMCCTVTGQPMRPQYLQKWWTKERAALGCDGYTLHELRHSNLSMVSRHLSPFDLKTYAGWSSLEPARIYIHDDLTSLARGLSDAWSL